MVKRESRKVRFEGRVRKRWEGGWGEAEEEKTQTRGERRNKDRHNRGVKRECSRIGRMIREGWGEGWKSAGKKKKNGILKFVKEE